MKGIRDWVFTQLLSNSLASSRSLSGGGSGYLSDAGSDNSDERAHTAPAEASLVRPDASRSATSGQENGFHHSLQQVVEDAYQSNYGTDEKDTDSSAKIENLRIKFFRLLRRFGLSQENLLVAKVLYRVHVATSIRTGESDLKRIKNDRAKAVAAEQEASGVPELNFSIRILVLGKTGVGKSATINSILNQTKTVTDAFHPATDCIQEVVGTINGLRVTFVDTPGFLPASLANVRRNRKIMLSVRRFIRKSPPDIILFVERLDLINIGYSDFPLLKLMTEVFSSTIWFNTIIVMTHASSTLPEGPGGYSVNYESYVTQCTDLIQHYIHQAVSDTKIENPVVLVENHPQCRKNFKGEATLPNGQVWKDQFFLLCLCTKFLGDVNALLDFQDGMKLGPSVSPRVPYLPHLLSSLLQHHAPSGTGESELDIDEYLLLDTDEEDDYDQLPPIQILTKSQFERLSKEQKKEYLDELDYREILYLKKQLKEECQKRKEKLSREESVGADDDSDGQQASPEAVLLPDMAISPSFDSDCAAYRYRCLVTINQWLVRPVLDPQGWDHDVGFDGINLETAAEVKKNTYVSIAGQMKKDKRDFNVQSECAAAYLDPRGPTYSLGLDVQSAGKDMIYTARSNLKLKILRHNVTDCVLSLTSFGGKYYAGAKIEDTMLIGRRLKLVMKAGQMRGPEQVANGGTFEATVRGGDYPMRNDSISFSLTAISFNKEMVLGGGLQSEFWPIRGMKVAVNANLNSRKMGQVSLKMSSFEHIEIAVIAVFSIFKALLNEKSIESRNTEN